MQEENEGIVFVLARNRDKLIDAADRDEAGLLDGFRACSYALGEERHGCSGSHGKQHFAARDLRHRLELLTTFRKSFVAPSAVAMSA
jgi:hypothetical protein